ncbi:hypothetical protein SODALDRAFT_375676 [Sodiomyces alkalinus F11]|uniref:Uncharacterized protein n=1 Tax=Sodiomyces alkalinus (strain CBS 110278 / VKM F-3762 / F11) TaxID=1314773 RepID=A0A3N2Q9X3_SODAK|nr:hypothetical protein SODALDRAFT_375676 [Sodiomyces alkalinus F11]ROT43507.1 hypothetical protein SODALDRAFT_375676 [Sodiomyces alkalinus F11]
MELEVSLLLRRWRSNVGGVEEFREVGIYSIANARRRQFATLNLTHALPPVQLRRLLTMALIVVYHYLEVNADDDGKASQKSQATNSAKMEWTTTKLLQYTSKAIIWRNYHLQHNYTQGNGRK